MALCQKSCSAAATAAHDGLKAGEEQKQRDTLCFLLMLFSGRTFLLSYNFWILPWNCTLHHLEETKVRTETRTSMFSWQASLYSFFFFLVFLSCILCIIISFKILSFSFLHILSIIMKTLISTILFSFSEIIRGKNTFNQQTFIEELLINKALYRQ